MKRLLSAIIIMLLVAALLPIMGTAIAKPLISEQPENITAKVGDTVVFGVECAAVQEPQCQWKFIDASGTEITLSDDEHISGAQTTTLTLTNVSQADMGSYFCTALYNSSSDNSAYAALIITEAGAGKNAPVITREPADMSSDSGEYIFSVGASGVSAYKWYGIKDGMLFVLNDGQSVSGTTDSLLRLTGKTVSDCVLCVVSNDTGTTISRSAKLKTNEYITFQPSDLTVVEGDDAVFTVGTSANGAEVRIQWYKQDSAGQRTELTDEVGVISGATTPVLTVHGADSKLDGFEFFCTVEALPGFTESDRAVLNVVNALPSESKLSITSRPSGGGCAEGQTFTLSVTVKAATEYQWYEYNETGCKRLLISKTNTLTVTGGAAGTSSSYFCIVSDGTKTLVTSDAQVMFYKNTDTGYFSIQPSVQTVCAGDTVIFSVKYVANSAFTYQWYMRSNSGYTAIADSDTCFSGTTTDTLTIKQASSYDNGMLFYCMVNEGGKCTESNDVPLTVIDNANVPLFTLQPADSVSSPGGTASFTVKADGATSYEWYRINSKGELVSVNDNENIKGSLTSTLTLTNLKTSISGTQFVCVASGNKKSNKSDYATLTVTDSEISSLTVTAHPSDTLCAAGDSVTLTAAAAYATGCSWFMQLGNILISVADDDIYSGAETSSLTIKGVTPSVCGDYVCIFTDETDSVSTDAASVAISEITLCIPVITKQPGNASTYSGGSIEYHAAATNAAEYRWYVLCEGVYYPADWIFSIQSCCSGITSDTLAVTPEGEMFDKNEISVFCVVTSETGVTACSNAASVTLLGEYERIPGNVDLISSDVNIADALALFKHIAGTKTIANVFALKNADVNGDEQITIADALMLFKYVAGIISSLK